MTLKTRIGDELIRSPLAAISGLAGVVIAALSLLLAWVQYKGTGTAARQTGAIAAVIPASGDLALGNVFLDVGYFLAITIAAAIFLQAIGRKHNVTALFSSIPILALTNFSGVLIIYLAPPRPLNSELFASAHDLIFYASTSIVSAFSGKNVLIWMLDPGSTKTAEPQDKSKSDSPDGGVLTVAILALVIWSWLIFAGQTRLTRTLLPAIAHPTDSKPVKSGI